MELVTSYIAPSIGSLMSVLLFAGSFPEIVKIRKTNEMGDTNPLLFPFIYGSTMGWSLLGAIVQDPFYLIGNCPGIYLGLLYSITCHRITQSDIQRNQMEISIISLTIFWTVLGSICVFIPRDIAENMVGVCANVLTIVMFASPLSTVFEIVRTKSSESINRLFMMMQIISCVSWSIYGIFTGAYVLLPPNATGLLLGIIQLVLVIKYPRNQTSNTRSRKVSVYSHEHKSEVIVPVLPNLE